MEVGRGPNWGCSAKGKKTDLRKICSFCFLRILDYNMAAVRKLCLDFGLVAVTNVPMEMGL
jgi:hypothetical protein